MAASVPSPPVLWRIATHHPHAVAGLLRNRLFGGVVAITELLVVLTVSQNPRHIRYVRDAEDERFSLIQKQRHNMASDTALEPPLKRDPSPYASANTAAALMMTIQQAHGP